MKLHTTVYKLIFILTLILCLSACSQEEEEYSIDFLAMDTVMSIKVYGNNAQEHCEEARDIVYEMEEIFSKTIETSETSRLNSGETIVPSEDFLNVLNISLDVAKKTSGAFDPTLLNISNLWNIGSGDERIPSEDEINIALETVSYENIIVLDSGEVYLENNAQLDFGGVAKGYAADKVVEYLKGENIEKAVISLAGNIYVLGEKDKDTDWVIGISDPDDSTSVKCSVNVSDASIVTTGDYERYFEEDGIRYHHIFSSQTGYPAVSDIRSVTVIGETSAYCDALSTAFFVMGKDETEKFLEGYPEYKAVIITDTEIIGDCNEY